MPYSGTFGLKFQKVIVISEVRSLEFFKIVSLTHTVNFRAGFGLAFFDSIIFCFLR